ncbi:MAG: PSD1 and planctomycete cytochrome C domain-containing protein [Pirellulaceae bacterium]|nr:PSD1 and planctomycete cytochrome C domain-containing protein [Pirellulaceae bacterium]
MSQHFTRMTFRDSILANLALIATAYCLCMGIARSDDEISKEQLDFFEAKIRPVLVRECYSCHSAEAASKGKLRGELLLDSRDATRKGGETGPAVVPGKAEESLLLSALKHEDLEMPPKGKLDASIIADFEKWIQSGAADPRTGQPIRTATVMDVEARRNFWSFQPLRKLDPPQVVDSSHWVRSELDRFVLERLESSKLAPNPVADARVLVRRAWFDLLGLPPTPDEMREWSAKIGSDGKINNQAWAALIDHLLDSPHYGERQARHWMDVARFAESHGYEQDYDRPNAYHYRDFLIRAFNDDLPYDQFVQWQLAGDELAPEEPLAWMATGFLCGGAFPTQLTEAEFESARYDELDDMVATTGVAFLGLSIGCARCHDHKFDPIPVVDYYRMAATFTTAIRCEKKLDLEPQENAKRREAFAAKLSELDAQLQTYAQTEMPQQFNAWLGSESSRATSPGTWIALAGNLTSTQANNYQLQQDGSYLSVGAVPPKDEITLASKLEQGQFQAIRLEALTHDSLPGKGPGRADNGNFALGDIRLTVKGKENEPKKFVAARATHQQNADSLSVAASIDNDPVSGWAVDGQIGKDQAAVFQLEQPLVINTPTEISITLKFHHPNPKHSVGRFRLSVTSDPNAQPAVGDVGPPQSVVKALTELRAALAKAPGAKLYEQPGVSKSWQTAIEWYKTQDAGYRQRLASIEEAKKAGAGEKFATAMVTSEGLPILSHHANDRGFPHFYPDTYQLRRGDVNQKGEKADAGFLQVFTSTGGDLQRWKKLPPSSEPRLSYRRSALARWITDAEQGAGHLAARVMANRIWQHHFGRGLVATPNDFGSAGELPTHPELLDYLASQMIAGNWHLKRIHKLIMTSGVYMQSSTLTPDDPRLVVDRENQLYWRRVPQRLEAEAIRDSLLAASGQLDTTMYGPGSIDSAMRRRSVYFFIKRSQLIPMMMLFDWPEHLVSIGQRPLTTIAPQALMFMNNPQGREYAAALAKRISAASLEQSVNQAYWSALSREPQAAELKLALEFLNQQTALRKSAHESDAELSALTDLCQTIMSMNEFLYVD